MNGNHLGSFPRFVALATMLVALALVSSTLTASNVAASPQRQLPDCGWGTIGSSPAGRFHVASALDTVNKNLWLYGGLDAEYALQPTVEYISFNLADDRRQAEHHVVPSADVPDAMALAGAAGAYRAPGGGSGPAGAFFIGGLSDIETGDTVSAVQRLITPGGPWEVLDDIGGEPFTARAFAAAAYDPKHDVIWVVGGIEQCPLAAIPGGGVCTARSLPTQYLSFDPETGAPKWNTLSGGDQAVFAHSMVWDRIGERMILFGGTTDIRRGTNRLMALDLSADDAADARFATLLPAIPGPRVYFHSAALDDASRSMVVRGGVAQGYFSAVETPIENTWALDLSRTGEPEWVNLVPSDSWLPNIAGTAAHIPWYRTAIYTLGRAQSSGEPAEDMSRRTLALDCGPVDPGPISIHLPLNLRNLSYGD